MEIKVLNKQIISFSFSINPDLKQVKAEVETKVKYGTPKNDENHSVIMLVRIDVHADNPEDFCIKMEEQVVFGFDTALADYDDILKDLFQTKGVAIVSDDFDKALEGIGKPSIRFKDHYGDSN